MIKGTRVLPVSLKAGKMISENLYELISTILYYEIVTPPDAKISWAIILKDKFIYNYEVLY